MPSAGKLVVDDAFGQFPDGHDLNAITLLSRPIFRNTIRETLIKYKILIPANAGIVRPIKRIKALDTGARRRDDLFSASLAPLVEC